MTDAAKIKDTRRKLEAAGVDVKAAMKVQGAEVAEAAKK